VVAACEPGRVVDTVGAGSDPDDVHAPRKRESTMAAPEAPMSTGALLRE
jgi:hypothetical protein